MNMTANAENETQQLPLVLSVARAAREYGFDSGTLMEAIREGKLRASRPTARTIRVFRKHIEEWMAEHAVTPGHGSPRIKRRLRDPVVRKRLEREGRAPKKNRRPRRRAREDEG
jgi:hypothetical protein